MLALGWPGRAWGLQPLASPGEGLRGDPGEEGAGETIWVEKKEPKKCLASEKGVSGTFLEEWG